MRTQVKEPVRIRQKRLKNGSVSLYLDIYQHGKRAYKFLGLYLVPEGTPLAKERNRTTMMQAESEKARLIIQMQGQRYGAVAEGLQVRTMLSDYCKEMQNGTRSKSQNNHYRQLSRHIKEFGDIRLAKVTANYIRAFVAYMQTDHSKNTVHMHYANLCTTLRRAKNEGLICYLPFEELAKWETPKTERKERNFLTLEEIQRIADTEPDTRLQRAHKHAFLFSCFTGLRLSDIKSLKWSDIHEEGNGGKYIRKTMDKTHFDVTIPLCDEALRWLPKKKPNGDSGTVFYDMPRWNGHRIVSALMKKAGITDKVITFHCARHTFATMLITQGADLYVTSKLLGHQDIATTQIYAKVVQDKKRDAVQLLPTLSEPEGKE